MRIITRSINGFCVSGLAMLLLCFAGPVQPARAQMNEPVQASQPLNRIALKDLGRLQGWRDNALVGYGLVTGLAGSGDTRRSAVTRVALRNVLNRLGTNVADEQISTRNIAVVLVTGRLPPSANVGDQIDVTVSSIGDARSLAGGTLLMTPLMGPDRMVYALAQGGLVTGGYRFEAQLNREQSNYPTSATLPNGATVERAVQAQLLSSDNSLSFILREPSFTTAQRIADAVNVQLGAARASVVSADEVHIMVDPARGNLPRFIAMLENLAVVPDRSARIVINEKSGTVVAGGDVRLSSIVISQGDLRISVISDNEGSQPSFIGGFATDISSLIITNTQLTISEGGKDVAMQFPNTSVASLVEGLNRAEVDTRRIISILQAIKAAGALHAEIIVQ